MSDIQSLTDRAASLSQSIDWWNTAMIWALVFVAIAAITVVVTTRVVINRAKQLSDVQDELIRAKDGQLTLDLKEKDGQIAEAKAGVAVATENAAKANERAASLERDAAQAKLETERLKSQLAWRSLPQNLENLFSNALSNHAGKVNIQHVANDTEAQYFAIQLANIFGRAGWEVGLSSVSMSGVAIFGIWVPDTKSPSTQTVRNALGAIGIGFSTQALPVGGAGFSSGSTIADAPILFIGSKPIKQ